MEKTNSDIDLTELIEKIKIANKVRKANIDACCKNLREDYSMQEYMGSACFFIRYRKWRGFIEIEFDYPLKGNFHILYDIEKKSICESSEFNEIRNKILRNKHTRALLNYLIDSIAMYIFLEKESFDFPMENGLVATIYLNGNSPTYKYTDSDTERKALSRVRIPQKDLNDSFIRMIDIADNHFEE